MLSGQTNSLGRGYGAAPITDWFNPSSAHHSLCSSKGISETRTGVHGPDMGQTRSTAAT
jgi:hypothetical protein